MRIKFLRTIIAPVGDGTGHEGEVYDVSGGVAHELIGQGAAEETKEPLTHEPKSEPTPKTSKKTGHEKKSPVKGKKKK